MSDTHKLLLALCDALGFEVEGVETEASKSRIKGHNKYWEDKPMFCGSPPAPCPDYEYTLTKKGLNLTMEEKRELLELANNQARHGAQCIADKMKAAYGENDGKD